MCVTLLLMILLKEPVTTPNKAKGKNSKKSLAFLSVVIKSLLSLKIKNNNKVIKKDQKMSIVEFMKKRYDELDNSSPCRSNLHAHFPLNP